MIKINHKQTELKLRDIENPDIPCPHNANDPEVDIETFDNHECKPCLEDEYLCIHCYRVFKIGDAIIDAEGLLECAFSNCDGSLFDFIPKEDALKKGWLNDPH